MQSPIELSPSPAEAHPHLSAEHSVAAPFSTTPKARKQINSRDLLQDQREVEIEHAGQIYRLRLTALGKLILTK